MDEISINKADAGELSMIPCVTREMAAAISRFRDLHGEFRDWWDLLHIPGFSIELVDEIRRSGVTLDVYDEGLTGTRTYRGEHITRGGKGGFGNDDMGEE